MSAVDDLINDARNYAITVTTAGVSAMAGATSAVEQIGRGYISGTTPKVDVKPPVVFTPGEVPEWDGKRPDLKPFTKSAPTLSSVGTLTLPSEPGNAPNVESFNDPQKPIQAPMPPIGEPSINTGFQTPQAPNIYINSPPTLIPITLPTAPVYQPPQFQGTKPAFNLTAPTAAELSALQKSEYSTMSAVFRDAITNQIDSFIDREFPQHRASLAVLEARLQQYMAGGTALTPAIENAIYNRTLDKTNEDANRMADGVWVKSAKAGFSMPGPMIASQLFDVEVERRKNNARAATDIAVKQAELEQQNVQFAIEQCSSLRKVAIDAAMSYYSGLIQINAQAIDYARGIVDAVVKAFDLACRYAETQIRIYEADMRRYEMDLKAALQAFEVYEQQVKGELAKVEVNKAQVDVYRAQLDAITAQVNVYRAQIEALNGQISLEKLKVELYQAKVQGYVAQVNGYTAQWNGYQAAVSGEVAKVNASAEAVRAFTAKTQAFEAIVRARSLAIEAVSKSNDQKVQTYKAEVEAFAALSDANVKAMTADVASYQATIAAFQAQTEASASHSKAEIALYEVAQRGIRDAAELQFKYMQERNALDVARATAAGNIGASIGNIFASTAQAALAGMNILAAKTETVTA